MQRLVSMVRTWLFTSGDDDDAGGDDDDHVDNHDADIRSHERSIAAPLSLGVKGLKNNLKEEGLFR